MDEVKDFYRGASPASVSTRAGDTSRSTPRTSITTTGASPFSFASASRQSSPRKSAQFGVAYYQDFDVGTFYNFAEWYGDDKYCNVVLALLEEANPGSRLRTQKMMQIINRRWKDENSENPEVIAESSKEAPPQVMYTLPSVFPDGSIRWDHTAYRLPTGREKQSYQDRAALLKYLDRENTGRVTIDDLKIGLTRIVSMPGIDEQEPLLEEVTRHAQKAVSDLMLDGVPRNDDDILAKEFRVFLMFLQGYLDLWEIFGEVEKQHQEMISLDEFLAVTPKLKERFFKDPSALKNPDFVFSQIDTNESGYITFGEFADYCVRTGRMDEVASDLRNV